ncbi:MAG: LLM class flavin-dependent oxidoreductase [Chloroflexi bacterium]|nr:LLM class flavin-dependent oxidoreductase [Chloroflexota bacterium]MYD48952.1 LLM class flavin-dependent oxidoreductase [Chloroflexota bacterium]
MALQFGVFDHIEPIPGVPLDQIYRERLDQIAYLEDAGFYSYHLAEHHTPAVHSLAPSQNVFLAAAAERTRTMRLGPCVYVLPLHHPVRLIEEICMLDNLSDGRMDIGVGRGGIIEAYFWGQEGDVETNYARYLETLAVVRQGLGNDSLTYQGEFYNFDDLPMRLRPKQDPYPPLWYMRNVETSAVNGMHSIIVGNLDSFGANVERYFQLWDEHQGPGALNAQGEAPKIGLVNHLYLAQSDAEAATIAQPAWDQYKWNLAAPRRLEAERRGLTQFMGSEANPRPSNLPDREAQAAQPAASSARRSGSAALEEHAAPGGGGFNVVAGSPDSIRSYMDDYLETGANYFVAGFQWGHLSHEETMRSIELFVKEVMPHYM